MSSTDMQKRPDNSASPAIMDKRWADHMEGDVQHTPLSPDQLARLTGSRRVFFERMKSQMD